MPRWGRNVNGLCYKHMCIMYLCFYIQGWVHDGEHLCVCSSNFELQQGHAHHTRIIYGCNYCQALIVNRWDLFPCITGGVGWFPGGGEVTLCQVVCEDVVAVGLGLHFLYLEGGKVNHCLNYLFASHCLKALRLL